MTPAASDRSAKPSMNDLCSYQPASPGKVVSESGCGLKATKRD